MLIKHSRFFIWFLTVDPWKIRLKKINFFGRIPIQNFFMKAIMKKSWKFKMIGHASRILVNKKLKKTRFISKDFLKHILKNTIIEGT